MAYARAWARARSNEEEGARQSLGVQRTMFVRQVFAHSNVSRFSWFFSLSSSVLDASFFRVGMCYMQATVEQRAEMSVRENRRSGYRTLHVLPKIDGFRNGGRCDLCQVPPHEQGAADTIMHM
jgi:hypothetical protein